MTLRDAALAAIHARQQHREFTQPGGPLDKLADDEAEIVLCKLDDREDEAQRALASMIQQVTGLEPDLLRQALAA